MRQIPVVHPVIEALRKTAPAGMLRQRSLVKPAYTQREVGTLDAPIKGD